MGGLLLKGVILTDVIIDSNRIIGFDEAIVGKDCSGITITKKPDIC